MKETKLSVGEVVVKAFVAYTNTDTTEGRGVSYPLVISECMTTAKRMSIAKGVQGCDCEVYPVNLVYVDGKLYGPVRVFAPTEADIALDKRVQSRQAALEKAKKLGMTGAEIQALNDNP